MINNLTQVRMDLNRERENERKEEIAHRQPKERGRGRDDLCFGGKLKWGEYQHGQRQERQQEEGEEEGDQNRDGREMCHS